MTYQPMGAPAAKRAARSTVLFACVHNSGRSVAAQVVTRHYAGGSAPGQGVNPAVAAVLDELGLSAADHVPTVLDAQLVAGADVVVTMGCGETCPFFPGKRYEDCPAEDPAGQDADTVRRIVADIDARVRHLLAELLPGRPLPPALLDR
jgi:arsenate reductase